MIEVAYIQQQEPCSNMTPW